jgi:hypothetical protein
MNNKDLSLLSEAYSQIQRNTVEEAGFLSQLGAKAEAVKDAFKQGVENVKHVVKGEGGNARNEKGQVKPIVGWKKTYEHSKQANISKSLASDIINDIKGTGLVPAGYNIDEQHLKYWEEAINKYVDFINNKKGRAKYEEEKPEFHATAVGKEKVSA